jgi:hypothetical protein
VRSESDLFCSAIYTLHTHVAMELSCILQPSSLAIVTYHEPSSFQTELQGQALLLQKHPLRLG